MTRAAPASKTALALRGGLALLAAVALAWIVFALVVRPSNDRPWAPEQARMPVAIVDGEAVRVADVRNARYRSTTDFDLRWEARDYRLDDVESAWFIVEPFADWRGPAHTFVSFGFRDGRHLAISAEVRKEVGEAYSPLAGLLRQYELMLVLGDERDLIGLRAAHRRDAVYLYRLEASPVEARALLVALLDRANVLAERPAFYNTLTANCTTTIVDAVDALAPGTVPMSWRTRLPGYSDDLAFDLGLIDTDLPRDRYREAHRIDGLARDAEAAGLEGEAYSAAIRSRWAGSTTSSASR
ncbi:DUF4105 domain-containing protein [Silanimonas sp.]|uniref:Lnb N-terminal periplasmic domain-containing protein n=1 Tax=Silanimonas sp. TaxID=1929290 RepID=UPI0022BC0340|nr:DUF4105 domain-containing protein [Silanimonas sp.]MCZ8113414.1 DUF4105 domain-containing protein [Silanimonas sp.]